MIKIILFVFGVSLLTSSFAQNVSVIAQNSIGGSGDDYVFYTKNQTSNQYWVYGFSNSGSSGNHTATNYGLFDFWLTKLNSNLQPEWDLTFGGSDMENLPAALVLDNYVIVGGPSKSPVSGNKTAPVYGSGDVWLICVDTLGNELWQYSYGGDAAEADISLTSYSDSSFLSVVFI